MSEEDISVIGLPDAETCQKLCEQFADITQTDTICAQMYLQERNWNLEFAIGDYFQEPANEQQNRQTVSNTNSSVPETNPINTSNIKRDIKFITWNCDGLDQKNLILRIKRICNIIKTEDVDIIFLQEIVPETKEIIVKQLPDYKCIVGGEFEYFTVTLLKNSTVSYIKHEIYDYPTTRMMRNLLHIEITIQNIPFVLMNTHLESTGEATFERQQQLKVAFSKALEISNEKIVILAGDLNLRDKELESVGLPTGVEDVWKLCGSRKECAYTWDMTRNDNLNYNSGSRFKPRFRFDRVYLRQSSPSLLVSKYFELIGLERLLPHRCFPSDHWGILCHFSVDN